MIHLAFITFNRLEYTRLALTSVLADPTEEFSLTIWDNASTDGTAEYLRDCVRDRRIIDLILSNKNVGQIAAVNEIWRASKADLLGKLDNDCIVSPGWTRVLSRAHADIPQLGAIACWHYFPDDFDYDRAKHKIQEFNGHRILRHPWICGTGFLIKRPTFERLGPIQEKTTTNYWLQMAVAGYVNGFYYPLVLQEHMDDPKSRHSHLHDEASYQSAKPVTVSVNRPGLSTLADWWWWRQEVLNNLLDDPWEVKHYVGWRRKIRNAKARLRLLWRRVWRPRGGA